MALYYMYTVYMYVYTGECTELEDGVQGGDALGPTEKDPSLLDDVDPDGRTLII